MMILRITIFGIYLFGTLLLKKHYLLPRRVVLPDIVFLGVLLAVFLILLYLEIRSLISQGNISMMKLRWRGFHFTFWTGVQWWFFLSLPESDFCFSDAVRLISSLFELALGGVIFGVMGMAITQFMLLIVFKRKDEE